VLNSGHMESVFQKRCICGGLIVTMLMGGVAVEACEHGAGASACRVPGIEYSHTHFPEPQGPYLARQSFVLGTGTDTRTGPIPGYISTQPQSPEFPYASFVRPSVMSPALIETIADGHEKSSSVVMCTRGAFAIA
jgi:hypothetical protein